MPLNVINEHNYKLLNFKTDSRRIFSLALERLAHQKHRESLSVVFSSKEEIILLNKRYRQVERETDVLSFPFDTNLLPGYLGDIVICYPVAVAQAIKYGHSLRRELSFLFLHGMLHLLGYDHLKLEDEIVMFALQEEILNHLGIKRKKEELVHKGSEY